MKVIIVSIGDEILMGQVVNTNAAWLANECTQIGFEVQKIISIGDKENNIIEALTEAISQAEVVIMTGGLGPTSDDITAKVVATFFKKPLVFKQHLWSKIEKYCALRGKNPDEILKKQCYVPADFDVLNNDLGTAPGIYFQSSQFKVCCLPGVPYEMKHIFINELKSILISNFIDNFVVNRSIHIGGVGETEIALKIREIENNLPPNFKIAYLPNLGFLRIRLTQINARSIKVDQEFQTIFNSLLQTIGEEDIFGFDDDTIIDAIATICNQQNLKLGFVESCTGGNISANLVNKEGVSSFFEGSLVSYSYGLKQSLVNVDKEILASKGAVSKEVVIQMAENGLKLLNVHVCVSVSGIAGPDGGTENKEVGTYWLGFAQKGKQTNTLKLKFNKNRAINIQYVTNLALIQLRKYLINS